MADARRRRVLMIGLKSAAVDFAKWPQLSVEKLEAAFVQVRDEVAAAGFEPAWCLVGLEGAEAEVRAALDRTNPDIVLIGAGLRADPDHLTLFEALVNLVHAAAPQARLAFNALPHDSVAAIRRQA